MTVGRLARHWGKGVGGGGAGKAVIEADKRLGWFSCRQRKGSAGRPRRGYCSPPRRLVVAVDQNLWSIKGKLKCQK